MLLFGRIKTWIFGENISSADLNAEFNNILNNVGPEMMSGHSSTVGQMQIQTDPGSVGNESLSETESDELERLRFAISRLIGQNFWYDSPALSIANVNTLLATGNALPTNRIVSGKTLSSSNQPAFLVADGTAAKVTLKGATSPFVYFVGGTEYTISSDVSLTFSSFAPSSNNTATLSDTSIIGDAASKVKGEGSSILTLSSVGSNITALQGNYAAFKLVDGGSTEYFLGFVNSSTQITKAFRGYFFDSTSTPIPRIAINNGDTITLMKLFWIFATASGTLDSTPNNPTVSAATPSSPSLGDYWFDLSSQLWKKYNGSSFAASNATLIGYALVDTTKCFAARSFEFYGAYDSLDTAQFEIQDNNTVRTSATGAEISVAGKVIRFSRSLATWIKPTNLDSGVTDGASKTFYVYLKDTGDVVLSDAPPYDRNASLRGYYHPYNPWRALASVTNDSSSHFASLSALSPAEFLVAQLSTAGADQIASKMSSVGALAISTSRTRSAQNIVATLGNMALSPSMAGGFANLQGTTFQPVMAPSSTFAAAAVNTGTSTITKTSHGFVTGQIVSFTTSSALPAGISLNADYFMIVVDANSFKIATSYANALAGTNVSITTQGTGNHTAHPEAGVTLATSGNKPVKIGLMSDGSLTGGFGGIIQIGTITLSSPTGANFQFVRINVDGSTTTIGYESYQGSGSTGILFSSSILSCMDLSPVSGVVSYVLKFNNSTSDGDSTVQNSKLYAFEEE